MTDRLPGIPHDHPLRDCPTQPVSLIWPSPIGRRLDELVDRARTAGRDTTRKELLAALVLASPHEPSELDDIVKEYRLAVARDALIEPKTVEEDNVLVLPRYRPGPR